MLNRKLLVGALMALVCTGVISCGGSELPKEDSSRTSAPLTGSAEGIFEGTSVHRNFDEALALAIATARQQLPHTDAIHWTLLEIFGDEGGFVGVQDLTVRIHARPGLGTGKSTLGHIKSTAH